MEKVQLDDLPESSNKEFWGEAEIHTNLSPQKELDSEHYFIRVTGHEAQCNHCSWGFALDPGDRVAEGHVYTRERELII